ncbi:hypothetical protein [Sphingopyxis sp. OAS728]|uniref:hypothetical protein n=1 Tax=Sphingopyxis sp. OAS728 TaxID=2663823 RepID=UPI00178B43F9|nr:hypothetical protein [Sphingopyxis sp. OAS728]
MGQSYRTVFDLTGQPELIQPAYWFIAIFLCAGIIFAGLAWMAVRENWHSRRSLPFFAAAWIIFCTFMVVVDFRDAAAIRNAVEAGKFRTVEGCLDYFRPGAPNGSKTTSGNEEWSIQGLVFSYGEGEVRPAFHSVSTAGGEVRADARVRVSFVVSPAYRRREIVKLELAPHACPMARNVKMYERP